MAALAQLLVRSRLYALFKSSIKLRHYIAFSLFIYFHFHIYFAYLLVCKINVPMSSHIQQILQELITTEIDRDCLKHII